MRLQRQARGLVVGRDMLAQRHFGQMAFGLLAQLARIGGGEQRQQIIIRQAAHIPQAPAACPASSERNASASASRRSMGADTRPRSRMSSMLV